MKRGRKRKVMDDDVKGKCSDRISQLPESVIHHILSYLDSKDATRSCVLSKAWRSLFSTFPLVDFQLDYRHFRVAHRYGDCKRARRAFTKFVDDSIARRIVHSFNISKFRLVVYGPLDENMFVPRMDHWLKVIKHKGVEELHLSLLFDTHYIVPRTIFLAESLTVLSLSHGCRLDVENLSGLKLGKLRELYLSGIELDPNGKIMENFLSGCPLMEFIELSWCDNLTSLCIPSTLLQLRKVVLHWNESLRRVEVQAPNLHAFEFRRGQTDYYYHNDDDETELVMDACKALKELTLGDMNVDDEKFQDLISSLPGIEVVKLDRVDGLMNLNFSTLYKRTVRVMELCDDFSSIDFTKHFLYMMISTSE